MKNARKLVGFMPWLRLRQPVSVAGFAFVPFMVSGAVSNRLESLKNVLPDILSSYVKTHKEPQANCVVVVDESAQNPTEAWNISEVRTDAAHNASSLLFLATWSKNEYFTPKGSYVNNVDFQLYFQRFVEPVDFIAFHNRRRDGPVFNAGLRHGTVHFVKPLNSSNPPP